MINRGLADVRLRAMCQVHSKLAEQLAQLEALREKLRRAKKVATTRRTLRTSSARDVAWGRASRLV